MIVSTLALASLLAGNAAATTGPAEHAGIDGPREAAFTTTGTRFRIVRTSRNAAQIVSRANAAVAAFGNAVQLEQDSLTTLANAAVASPTKMIWVRPVMGDDFVAMGYRQREDELQLINTYYLDLMPSSFPLTASDDVGETAARALMEDAVAALIAAGFVRSQLASSSPKVSYLREQHHDGTTLRSWVTEYQFTMTFAQGNSAFPDIGLTIGVHRKGVISSIHATEATVTNLGTVSTPVSLTQAEAALQASLASSFPEASYRRIASRQGVLLRPTLTSESIDPSGIFNYALAFPGGISRQRISRVSLVTGAIQHLYL